MIQGGDPTGTGFWQSGYTIADEYPKAGSPNYRCIPSRWPTPERRTLRSQFFIVTAQP